MTGSYFVCTAFLVSLVIETLGCGEAIDATFSTRADPRVTVSGGTCAGIGHTVYAALSRPHNYTRMECFLASVESCLVCSVRVLVLLYCC